MSNPAYGYPQQGGYPQQPQAFPQAPAPAYPPQQPPAYQPQQYAPAPQYFPPQQPVQPTVSGTLDDFLGQPSTGGGPSLKFQGKPDGTSYTGVVARKIGNGDVRQQTDNSNRPLFHKDGRPKFVLIIPLLVQPSPEFPEGKAQWWVKGQSRDELAAAMARAGSTAPVPEEGAQITVTRIGERPIPNMTPQIQYQIQYVPPNGAVQAPAEPQGVAPQYQGPVQPYAPQAPAPQPEYLSQQTPQFVAQPAAQQAPAGPTPPAAAAPAPAAPPSAPTQPQPAAPGPQATPEQQALLAQLANGGVPQQQG